MNSLVSPKRASRVLAALAAMTGLIFAAGCGSGSNIGTINPQGFSKASLSGTYVISISGVDVNGSGDLVPFAIAGTITTDGEGNIKTGTVDVNDPGNTGVNLGQTVSGTYKVTQDGRGNGTITTSVSGKFGIDFVLTSTSHGLITRFDSVGTGSGTIDLQGSASQSQITSLAFALAGSDSSGTPLATAGSVTLNATTGAVVSGIQDFNDGGSSSQLTALPITSGSSSLALASATSGTAVLKNTSASFPSLSFDVFVIDSTHLKLIETDATGAVLSGDAFTQQTSFPAGQLVFTLGGLDSSLDPLAVGGFVTSTANGALSNGTEDYNDEGTTGSVNNVGGSCNTAAPFPSGRCQLSVSGFSNGALNNFVFAAYPSSGGIQLLEIDGLGLLEGAAYAQSATSFGAGGYGLNLSGSNSNGEVDTIAQFNATTATSNNIPSGELDENDIADQLNSPVSFNGTYTPDATADGRGSIQIPTTGSIGTFFGGLTLQYYVVNSSTVVFIEVDSGQASVGTFELQSTPSSQVAAQSHMALVRTAPRPHGSAHRN